MATRIHQTRSLGASIADTTKAQKETGLLSTLNLNPTQKRHKLLSIPTTNRNRKLMSIIQQPSTQCNSFQSHSANGSRHPTDLNYLPLKPPKPKPKPKLHSSDIAYLRILLWCHQKNGKCYLTKEQWPEWLVRFGGKACHYRKQKARWAKMRTLGYAITKHHNGNRNKEMDHFITEEGILAVDNFLTLQYQKQKTAPRKTKNGPSKVLKTKKTAPPLTHASVHENKHAKALEKLSKEDYEKAETYRKLMEIGFYSEVIKEVMKKYKRAELYDAYNRTKERSPKNAGAYMLKLLKVLYS